jgi:hypothetical protein
VSWLKPFGPSVEFDLMKIVVVVVCKWVGGLVDGWVGWVGGYVGAMSLFNFVPSTDRRT